MSALSPAKLFRSSRALNKSLGVEIHRRGIPQGPVVRASASEPDPTTNLTGFVAFQPFDEIQGELAAVEQSSEQANGCASLARSDYAQGLEAAVNAQIKCVLSGVDTQHPCTHTTARS